jgi:hypothetical protein
MEEQLDDRNSNEMNANFKNVNLNGVDINCDDILTKIKEMGIRIIGTYDFVKFDGTKKEECETFLCQFEPYRIHWTDKEYFLHLENNLVGKAKEWFVGGKREIFSSFKEFKKEFTKMFGGQKISEIARLLTLIRTCKLEIGKFFIEIL